MRWRTILIHRKLPEDRSRKDFASYFVSRSLTLNSGLFSISRSVYLRISPLLSLRLIWVGTQFNLETVAATLLLLQLRIKRRILIPLIGWTRRFKSSTIFGFCEASSLFSKFAWSSPSMMQ